MTYASIIGTVSRISSQNEDCCSQMVSLFTDNGPVNILLSADTQVIDSRMLHPGLRIAVFYDANAPVPMIYPPQYRALLLTVLSFGEEIFLGDFDQNLTASDGSLQLRIGPRTSIVTGNGQNCSCCPGGHTLLVYYSTTTRSIPPQTTPRRIVVLC